MIEWFRSWHGAPTDNKWLVIARKAGVTPGVVSAIVWALLDHASQAEDRGSMRWFDVETYSAFSGFDEETIRRVIEGLIEKGVIDQNDKFVSWPKRQPKREDETAAERQRRRRDKKKGGDSGGPDGGGHDSSRDVTQRHAPEKIQSRIEQRREEQGSDASASARDEPAQPPDEVARNEIWCEYPRLLADMTGFSEERVRRWIGRVLRDHKPVTVLAALREAVSIRTGDPFGYVARLLNRPPAAVHHLLGESHVGHVQDARSDRSIFAAARRLEDWVREQTGEDAVGGSRTGTT